MFNMNRCSSIHFIAPFIALLLSISTNIESSSVANSSFYEEDDFKFQGIAKFYNKTSFYLLDGDKIIPITNTDKLQLSNNEIMIVSSRYSVKAIQSSSAIVFSKDYQKIDVIKSNNLLIYDIDQLDKKKQELIRQYLNINRYDFLPFPIKYLSKMFELFLSFTQTMIGSWAMSIIVLAFLMKLFLYPISIIHHRAKLKADSIKMIMQPKLNEVKSLYKGEEQHKKIIDLYQGMNISQNYYLFPSLLALIQIPFLIAIFNTLGEMKQLQSQEFFWISDLSRPDSIYMTTYNIPLIGNELNLLPIIMSITIIFSGFFSIESSLKRGEIRSRKLNTLIVALIFLVIFYHFPASMVLYWTVSNLFSFMQQKIIARTESS
jgi:YidC/Oxa1 family membrane protein insertase